MVSIKPEISLNTIVVLGLAIGAVYVIYKAKQGVTIAMAGISDTVTDAVNTIINPTVAQQKTQTVIRAGTVLPSAGILGLFALNVGQNAGKDLGTRLKNWYDTTDLNPFD